MVQSDLQIFEDCLLNQPSVQWFLSVIWDVTAWQQNDRSHTGTWGHLGPTGRQQGVKKEILSKGPFKWYWIPLIDGIKPYTINIQIISRGHFQLYIFCDFVMVSERRQQPQVVARAIPAGYGDKNFIVTLVKHWRRKAMGMSSLKQ